MIDDTELPNELYELSSLIEQSPESFVSGSKAIQTASLKATKFVFDLGALLFEELMP